MLLKSVTSDTSQSRMGLPLIGAAAIVYGQLKSTLSRAHASTAALSSARSTGWNAVATAKHSCSQYATGTNQPWVEAGRLGGAQHAAVL